MRPLEGWKTDAFTATIPIFRGETGEWCYPIFSLRELIWQVVHFHLTSKQLVGKP